MDAHLPGSQRRACQFTHKGVQCNFFKQSKILDSGQGDGMGRAQG